MFVAPNGRLAGGGGGSGAGAAVAGCGAVVDSVLVDGGVAWGGVGAGAGAGAGVGAVTAGCAAVVNPVLVGGGVTGEGGGSGGGAAVAACRAVVDSALVGGGVTGGGAAAAGAGAAFAGCRFVAVLVDPALVDGRFASVELLIFAVFAGFGRLTKMPAPIRPTAASAVPPISSVSVGRGDWFCFVVFVEDGIGGTACPGGSEGEKLS